MSENDLLGGNEYDEEQEEQPDPRIYKPDLYAAAMADDTDAVLEWLYKEVPGTYVDDSNGWTPLHWAAKNGNVVMLQSLLEHGASAPYHRMVRRAILEKEKKEKDDEAENTKNPSAKPSLDMMADDNKAESGEGDNGEEETKIEDVKPTEASNGDAAAEGTDAAVTATEGDNATAVTHTEGGATVTDGGENTGEATTAEAIITNDNNDVDEFDEDEDDLDYEQAMEKKLETSVELTKNTPLLWACIKGHLRVIWLLLIDGYSPNDLDDMQNNGLHLAACTGKASICQILIDDGVKSTTVNIYKNLPIDMATDKEVRRLILAAMEKGASMTESDIQTKHESNMKKYIKLSDDLEQAVKNTKSADGIGTLNEILRTSKQNGLDTDSIDKGAALIRSLEMGMELMSDISFVQDNMPMRTQEHIVDYVHNLESTIARARDAGVDQGQLNYAEELISRCEIEYWVSTLTIRLKDVTCAVDANEHDMNRLKQAIAKGETLDASADIVGTASSLHTRLDSELGMSRALDCIPSYRLPKKEGDEYPDDYWLPEDVGSVDESAEGYPHPVPESGEYVWIPAQAYTQLKNAIASIKSSYTGAEEMGANAEVVAECKTKLAKIEKDIKMLVVKDTEDRTAAEEHAHKLCKKKGGKKKK